MPKYTKYLEFSQKERTAIRERDKYLCIFCQIGYQKQLAEFYQLTHKKEPETDCTGWGAFFNQEGK